MAKWGEGDPRWIVEERPDSTNVNNWHWTEKNATSWSKELLKPLLLDVKHSWTEGSWKIHEVTKLEGEASASNRKGKLIFFYEWEFKAEWKGKFANSSEDVTGYLEVNNMSEENDPDDLDVRVSVTGSSKEGDKMKSIVYKSGPMYIKNIYSVYIQRLKEEFSQGMILPTKNETNVKDSNKTNAKLKVTENSKGQSPKQSAKTGVKVAKVKLQLTEEFKTSADQLYCTLTDEGRISAFTRAAAEVYAHPGGKFSIFNGNILGEFVELVPEKKIVQKWKFKDWPDGCYSTVTMSLEQKSDCTMLTLTQTGIPDHDFDRTEEGWKRHFWENMKSTFGFGARLF